jgi:mRNA interferase YafQ
MPSTKKSADKKRTNRPRRSDHTKAFAKDWERLSRSGRYDMTTLKEVMLALINNEGPLGPEWFDHLLKGQWADHRECHIDGDFLMIYQIDDDCVLFVRTGTHADLFE